MKLNFKISPLKIIVAILNLACIVGIIISSIVANSNINALTSQNGADKWKSLNSYYDYTQISCFFYEKSGITEEYVDSIRNTVVTSLQNASISSEKLPENARLWVDTYSANLGKQKATGTKKVSCNAEVWAVTSDFFLIHDFQLISGGYFLQDAIMPNGIVIDRTLAFQTFGSDDVAGLEISIGNVDYYVSGVVDIPHSKAEETCYGEFPKAYIPFENAINYASEETLTIDCYEIIIPNSVKNFGYNIISEFIEDSEIGTVVQNSNRFTAFSLIDKIKNLSNSVIIDEAIKYTWWENSARVTEIKVANSYIIIIALAIIPIISFIWIIIKLCKYIKKQRYLKKLFTFILGKIRKN